MSSEDILPGSDPKQSPTTAVTSDSNDDTWVGSSPPSSRGGDERKAEAFD